MCIGSLSKTSSLPELLTSCVFLCARVVGSGERLRVFISENLISMFHIV